MTPEQSIIEELKSKHESEIAALQDGMRTALKNWQWQERCLKDAIDKSAEEIKRLREDLQMVINAAHHFDTCRRCAEAESCYSGEQFRLDLQKFEAELKEGQCR